MDNTPLLIIEILEVIFSFLTKDKDIRRCHNVCKTWRSAIAPRDYKIDAKFDQENCHKLLEQVSQDTAFASKIRQLSLRLYYEEHSGTKKKEIAETLRSIANQCTNLVCLKFTKNSANFDCLKALCRREARLYNIQHIKIEKMPTFLVCAKQ